jgi:hypothetical protein
MHNLLSTIEFFDVTSKKGTRRLNFKAFEDTEFSSWDATNEQVLLNDVHGKKIVLEYIPAGVLFRGRDSSDNVVELRPPSNMKEKLQEHFKVKRKAPNLFAEPEKQKVGDIAIVSNFKVNVDDSYKMESNELEFIDSLFEKGYKYIIYSASFNVDNIRKLADNLEEGVVFLKDGVSKWSDFSFDRKSWDHAMFKKSNYNLFKNINLAITRSKVSYRFLDVEE